MRREPQVTRRGVVREPDLAGRREAARPDGAAQPFGPHVIRAPLTAGRPAAEPLATDPTPKRVPNQAASAVHTAAFPVHTGGRRRRVVTCTTEAQTAQPCGFAIFVYHSAAAPPPADFVVHGPRLYKEKKV